MRGARATEFPRQLYGCLKLEKPPMVEPAEINAAIGFHRKRQPEVAGAGKVAGTPLIRHENKIIRSVGHWQHKGALRTKGRSGVRPEAEIAKGLSGTEDVISYRIIRSIRMPVGPRVELAGLLRLHPHHEFSGGDNINHLGTLNKGWAAVHGRQIGLPKGGTRALPIQLVGQERTGDRQENTRGEIV